MKFKIPGKTFQNHLQLMSKVLNGKNTITILDNFLFRVEGDKLWITGSDSENMMVSWIEIFESDGDGAVAVSSRTMLDIAKEIGNQPIQFEMNDESRNIEVNYLNGHFEFMGINPDEFPTRREEEEESTQFVLPAEVVSKGIDNTLYAVSQDTLRPMMTGIFWDIKEDSITFVASDTHKLVRYINRQSAPGFEGGFVLPSKPAGIVKSIIGKEDEEVKVTMNSKGAVFEVGAFRLSCKFIKGNYPNYNRAIPANSPYTLTVDREAMLNAVRRVALFASKSNALVKLTVTPTNIKMVARDYDYSTLGEETVDCTYEGQEMTIGFSSNYMIEILSNLKCDDIKISLTDPARPGIFEPLEQGREDDILVLQMPMQVIGD